MRVNFWNSNENHYFLIYKIPYKYNVGVLIYKFWWYKNIDWCKTRGLRVILSFYKFFYDHGMMHVSCWACGTLNTYNTVEFKIALEPRITHQLMIFNLLHVKLLHMKLLQLLNYLVYKKNIIFLKCIINYCTNGVIVDKTLPWLSYVNLNLIPLTILLELCLGISIK